MTSWNLAWEIASGPANDTVSMLTIAETPWGLGTGVTLQTIPRRHAATNCIDFSATEYSEEDKDGAKHTDWKRTCRMLLKGAPTLQQLY